MKQFTFHALAALLLGCVTSLSHAQPSSRVYQPIDAIPPNAQSTPARPAIMLNMSKDHQLFYRAYNEYSDYNGDGQPDGGYLHSTTKTYSGYFDPLKCYDYSSADQVFKPKAMADTSNYCDGSTWSGNFLNWASMTRMDIVRKVLYGGFRSTDGGGGSGTSLTVLERASLPMDAHSFAKYYNGSDIRRLTPFNESEITFCNTTVDDNSAWSHLTIKPPLLRAARGNYALWNAHERRQCRWNEETVWDADGSGNGNNFAVTGLGASGNYPSRTTQALPGGNAGDFVVRVEVCSASLLGSERCKRYPNGNYKPIGLLQEYGESDRAEFGLITGSFTNNISGGVLRKNLSSFRDEVNYTTDGTFTSVVGIAGTLNRIRVYGYRYSDSSYSASSSDIRYDDGGCTYQLSGLNNNQCASWGNPIGEMFTEALRYLKGPNGSIPYGPATAYGGGVDPKGAVMGLPTPAWVDPFTRGSTIDTVFGLPQCRPINAINFNASVTSYDNDTQGPFTDLKAALPLNDYIDTVGTGEGVNGTRRFVGRVNGAGDSACTAKTVSRLSQVDGLCPSGPAYRGSFSLAGAAYWAHTNPLRTIPGFPLTSRLYGANKDPNYRVDTYSVALAPGLPRIAVNAPNGTAIIQPNYVLNKGGAKAGNGTLVDFRVVSQTATSGKYVVVWEDSEQGGDYDQDASGILEWTLVGSTLKVTTSTFADATANPQGFGYTISGTNRDGVHYHSGILNFSFTDPTNLPVTQVDGSAHPNVNSTGGCQACSKNQLPSQATYTVTGGAGSSLEDPLFYAAKWGGYNFATGGSPDLPDDPSKWDSRNGDGVTVPGGDGVPDNYFVVFNPDQLEAALRRVFTAILSTSNASPAVSAGQLIEGEFKYTAEFDQSTASGDVKAFRVGPTGNFSASPAWRLGEKLASANVVTRQIITNDGPLGLPFDWASISLRPTYVSMLTTGGVRALSVSDAQSLVDYMRGDRTRESGSTPWRVRPLNNIAGPIVNAAPWIQGRPTAAYFDNNFPGYRQFLLNQNTRTKLLWAASDDGMLHGVRAEDGTPVLSYVPGMLAPRLAEQAVPGLGVRAFVDGGPFAGDVWIDSPSTDASTEWRTYLFGSLGRGGRALYALDVTGGAGLTATQAANIFKWQFTADDDADLGYVLSDTSTKRVSNQAGPIAKLNNGKFAIIMGNGYQSSTGKAALMILPAEGPAAGSWVNRYHKLVADAGSGNGLSTATWVDLDNNGTADVVYAGDLKGNLWKFDISSTDPAQWRVAYAGRPLYTAIDGITPLPISSAPEVTFPSFGGLMVTFATGLANTPAEFPKVGTVQKMFGIWDRPAFSAALPADRRSLPRNYATLVQRSFVRNSDGTVSVSSAGAIDYQNPVAGSAKDGWYVNLPGSSEMVVSNLAFRFGNIFAVSIRPNSSGSSCDGLPESTLYVFDPVTGIPSSNVFGQSSSGPAGTIRSTVVGIAITDQKVTFVVDATGRALSYGGVVSGSAGRGSAIRVVGPSEDKSIGFNLNDTRIQWREIPGLRTRP